MHEQMYGPYNLSRPVHVVDPHRSWKPNVEIAPNCPRCDSSNTKFCYYNNYSLTQPRYFCKGCRRYWTKGGSLRNVPVGGGCRKKRRAKSSSSVRVSTSSVVNPSSRSRSSPVSDSSRALRPDLALDDMVGGSHRSIGIGMDDASTVTDGSGIDLAVLYSNFLNQSPQQPVDVSGGDLVGSSSSSDQVGLIGDFDYSFDPNGYESLSLPNVQQDDDVFFSTNPSSHVFQSLAAWQAAPPEHLQQAGFCAVSDVAGLSHHHHHHHHHQDLMGGDWCPPSIGQSSFGAF